MLDVSSLRTCASVLESWDHREKLENFQKKTFLICSHIIILLWTRCSKRRSSVKMNTLYLSGVPWDSVIPRQHGAAQTIFSCTSFTFLYYKYLSFPTLTYSIFSGAPMFISLHFLLFYKYHAHQCDTGKKFQTPQTNLVSRHVTAHLVQKRLENVIHHLFKV